jgi:hypothetical protein
MCEKCEQLSTTIDRYRSFVAQALDPLTTERVNAQIQELIQRKKEMH